MLAKCKDALEKYQLPSEDIARRSCEDPYKQAVTVEHTIKLECHITYMSIRIGLLDVTAALLKLKRQSGKINCRVGKCSEFEGKVSVSSCLRSITALDVEMSV